jgi:hypothetical protein
MSDHAFPLDMIEFIGKGEFGDDLMQHVRDSSGEICGKILWETVQRLRSQASWQTDI